ncbi:MAG TPA: hypothetical protein VGK50_08945 [Coriobacteriia bacterium]|jgi:hypothetical protein
MLDPKVWEEFTRLKNEHMGDRDNHNNYSSFNNEACRSCSFVYNSRGCLNCSNCDSCFECVWCVDCKDCAFCVGLNGARFQILNEQYYEEEYHAKLAELGIDTTVVSF